MESKRIIWSIDAFNASQEMCACAAKVIQQRVSRTQEEVLPVYVLNGGQLALQEDGVRGTLDSYIPLAESAIQRVLQNISVPGLMKPQVILQSASSNLLSADLLSEFAFKSRANLILVSSHGRKGVERFLLGSFAETLLLRSKVPVMVVGPRIRSVYPQEVLLFPTEFGPYSHSLFRKVVHEAKGLKAKLLLFHAVPQPIEPIFQSGVYLLGGSWIPVRSYFDKEVIRQERRAQAWARWASSEGVPTEAIVHSLGGAVSEQIVEIANQKQVGSIVMESHSGAIASVLIGSVTRQVMRSAPCPVWVFRFSKADFLRTHRPSHSSAA